MLGRVVLAALLAADRGLADRSPRAGAGRPIRTRPITLIVPFAAGRPDRHHRAHPRDLRCQQIARPERHHRQPRRRRRQHRHAPMSRAPRRTATRCCSPRPRSRSIPALFTNLPYDPIKDFAPISELVNAPNVLFVRPGFRHQLRSPIWSPRPRPSRTSSTTPRPGVGTKSHLTGELLKLRAGIDMSTSPIAAAVRRRRRVVAGHGAGRLGGARRRSSR